MQTLGHFFEPLYICSFKTIIKNNCDFKVFLMWPLYNIVSRFLHNHLRYMQTKLSGLDITQGGSVDLEVDKGDTSDAPSDPQDKEQNNMNVEEGKQHEEENETDVEEDNGKTPIQSLRMWYDWAQIM